MRRHLAKSELEIPKLFQLRFISSVCLTLHLLGGPLDPLMEVGNIGVDTRVPYITAAVAPGDDTHETISGHQWATGVTLAGVLVWGVGADHGVLNLPAVAKLARATARHIDDLQVDGQQMVGNGGAAGLGGAPSGNDGSGALTRIGVSDADLADAGAEAQVGLDADDGNVVDHGARVVALVVAEGADGVDTAAGAPVGAAHANL